MRRLTLVALACCLSTPAAALVKVAVPDVNLSGPEPSLGKILTEIIITELSSGPGIKVTGQSDIAAVLGFEKQKELMGCTDNVSCIAEIGGALGVDYLLVCDLGLLGAMYALNVKLIDVAKAEATKRIYKTVAGTADGRPRPDMLIEVVRTIVPEVLAAAGVAGSQPSASRAPAGDAPPAQPERPSSPPQRQSAPPAAKTQAQQAAPPPVQQVAPAVQQSQDDSAALAQVVPPPPREPALSAEPPSGGRTWPQWTLIIGGGALAIGGSALLPIAGNMHAEASESYSGNTIAPQGAEIYAQGALAEITAARRLYGISLATAAVGLGAAVTGLVWLLSSDAGGDPAADSGVSGSKAQLLPVPVPSGAALVMSASF